MIGSKLSFQTFLLWSAFCLSFTFLPTAVLLYHLCTFTYTQSPSIANTDLPAEVKLPEIPLLHPITSAQCNQACWLLKLGLSVAVRKSLNHALKSKT
jgi:hypothetical protein